VNNIKLGKGSNRISSAKARKIGNKSACISMREGEQYEHVFVL
jgi:hypothetical protein